MLCFIIVTLSVLTTSCTHIRHYSTFDEINTITKGKNANITLINEKDLIGKGIYIAPDSTFWLDPNTGNKQSIITSEVSSIVFKKRVQGAAEGLFLGLLGGVTAGILIGWASFDKPDIWFGSAKESATFGGFVLGCFGGLLGIPIGAIVGSKDKFIIKEMEIEKIKTKVKKEKFLFNVELSAPIIPNSTIKLEAPPHAIQNLLEHELSSKGFVVVSEGDADYILRFIYSVDKNNRLIGFTLHIVNSSTDKIVGVANFQSEHIEEIYIIDIIKEFVNQLCPNMK